MRQWAGNEKNDGIQSTTPTSFSDRLKEERDIQKVLLGFLGSIQNIRDEVAKYVVKFDVRLSAEKRILINTYWKMARCCTLAWCLSFRTCFVVYCLFQAFKWLWVEPYKENYLAFAKQEPSLEDFEKKLKSFQDVEVQLRAMEETKSIGMLLVNTSALYPQVRKFVKQKTHIKRFPRCSLGKGNKKAT